MKFIGVKLEATVKINKRYLNPDWTGYVNLYGVCRMSYAEARPNSSGSGTYRGLREFIAVFPSSNTIPRGGELFRLASGVKKLSDELKDAGEEVWKEAEQDLLMLFPSATVYLMLKASDDRFRVKHPEQCEANESFFVE
jgi:hypothetical protein